MRVEALPLLALPTRNGGVVVNAERSVFGENDHALRCHPATADDAACDTTPTGYKTKDACNACWRVLCFNDIGSATDRKAVLSWGHAERLNAYTHLLACAAVVALVATETARIGETPAARAAPASRVAAVVVAVAFAVSFFYHIVRTVPRLAVIALLADHTLVYASIATTTFAEVGVHTDGYLHSRWQTSADPLLAVGIVLLSLAYRHVHYDVAPWRYTNCALRIITFGPHDGLHHSTQAASSFALVIAPLLSIASLFRVAGGDLAMRGAAAAAGAVLLLVVGQAFEGSSGTAFEEAAVRNKCMRRVVLAPSACGMVCNSHAVWHVFAAAAALVSVAGREAVYAGMSEATDTFE